MIAWTSWRDGRPDAYVLDRASGVVSRCTWFGDGVVAGWFDEQHIMVASGHQEVYPGLRRLYRVGLDGDSEKLAIEGVVVGPAMSAAVGVDGRLALVTPNNRDSAFWKRYRGGTAGTLWCQQGAGWTELVADEPAGKYSPGWIGDRVLFTSDLGAGGAEITDPAAQAQLYSVAADGTDLRQHTHHGFAEGYVRDARTDGRRVVYHARGVVYVMDGLDSEPRAQRYDLGVTAPLPVDVEPVRLGSISVDEKGQGTLVEWCGAAYYVTHRYGPARALVCEDAVRVRLPTVSGDTQAVLVTDALGDDALEIVPLDSVGPRRRLAAGQVGRVLELTASPDGTRVAVASHDGRVIVVEVATGDLSEVGRSSQGEASGLAWSQDSRYLVWRLELGDDGSPRGSLQCTDLTAGTTVALTSGTFDDFSPVFSHGCLAWLSARNFDPRRSAHGGGLAYPAGTRVMVAPLRADAALPFGVHPDGWMPPAESDEDAKANEASVAIDVGLEARAVALPVPAGELSGLARVKDGLAWLRASVADGELGSTWAGAGEAPAEVLERYSFVTRKAECLADKADQFGVSGDGTRIVVVHKDEMTVMPDRKLEEDDEGRVKVDLTRLRRRIERRTQWRQMFDENGRLMAAHFWRSDMGGVDWANVLAAYRPLVDTAMTASDLYDILYECVAELGTSHAYVIPEESSADPVGYLGADVRKVAAGFEIERVLPGDSSDPDAWSPLLAAGVGLMTGDIIVAVDGRPADAPALGEHLQGAAGKTVELTVSRGGTTRRVAVTPLKSEAALRYHDWVAARAARVEAMSGGRLGYVHVPDMNAVGWAQLERRLGEARAHEGLLADMRYNRGGNTSQLVIDRLTQRVLGWDVGRHFARPFAYPAQGMRGPVVLLANQWSGSDGDIIAAVGQLHGLTVVGTRTWGGVIGIDGRYDLVDGTTVTQPRYALWLERFGWGIENHGVDPDVEVRLTPGDWGSEDDAQLDVAIEIALRQLGERAAATHPALPSLSMACH